MPGEDVTSTFYYELKTAVENKYHGKIATRLNYEKGGFTSLIKKTSRKLKNFDENANFLDQFIDVHKKWGDIEYWQALKRGTDAYHFRKYLTTFDYEQKFDGSIERIPEKLRINVTLVAANNICCRWSNFLLLYFSLPDFTLTFSLTDPLFKSIDDLRPFALLDITAC